MQKYLFYLKECLFRPAIFFKYQDDNPELIKTPWILQPIITLILLIVIHWISNTITVNEIKLDFEGLIIVHIDHLFFGLFLSIFIWSRTWISLKYFGKIEKKTLVITAWCNSPYILAFLILLCVFMIYMPLFGNQTPLPGGTGPIISSVQHGIGLIRFTVLVSDIWCILLLFTAVSIINPEKGKVSLAGAIAIFFLPSLILMTI